MYNTVFYCASFQMVDSEYDDDLINDMAEEASLARELSFLCGEEIVEQTVIVGGQH